MSCEHKNFRAHVAVNRFEDKPGTYMADVTISCAECSQAMQFVGMRMGLLWPAWDEPSTSADGIEARLPIRPFDRPTWISQEEHRLRTH